MRWIFLIRVCWHAYMRIIRMLLMCIFSLHTPWNRFLGGPWVGNVYSTMVICRKLSGLRPMSTSFIAIAIKTW